MIPHVIKKNLIHTIITLSIALFSAGATAHNSEHIQLEDSKKPTANTKLIVLIRHAEKAATPKKDPLLSPKGELRAQALISSLEETPLARILASQYTRTQATVSPIALHRDLKVEVIPVNQPFDEYLALMTKTIEQTSGNILVAGHSNTVPMLIKAFGGPEIPMIDEQEYGGLYLLKYPYTQESDLIIKKFGE